jgi:hypothetical protein
MGYSWTNGTKEGREPVPARANANMTTGEKDDH